jgi:uncharacterized membrane protein
VTELDWSAEQALQAIISAGLTAPPEIGYFKTRPAAERNPPAAPVSSQAPADAQNARPPLSQSEEIR